MISISIDDRPQIARQITDIMSSIDENGEHYVECDVEKALKTIAQIKPEVIWLDIEMPGINGLDAAATIKKTSPYSNIVFVTGHPEYAVDAFGLHVSGFIVKPVTKLKMLREIEHINTKKLMNANVHLGLRAQCFGNFEVFYNGKNIPFKRSRSKEAFAYLIDRRGAGCTVGEICSVLWEEKQADTKRKAQCRVILSSLKKDLEAVGSGDVLVKLWNTWSVDTTKLSCDYYDFLRKDNDAINSFRGEYMAQYSWAEMTIGNLYDISYSRENDAKNIPD